VGAARIGRFVYVVGGFERDGRRTTAAMERYDVESDSWERLADMPVALNHSVAAAYRGDLYVMGGYASATGLDSAIAGLFRYDPETDRWSRLPRAPSRRAAHAMGVIGNRLYVAGGARGGRPLRSLEVYSFKRRRWSRGPRMRVAREHLAGTVAGGFLYVLAGRAAGEGNFTVAERYDPRRRRWQRLPDMRKARGGIAAAPVGRRVVVFGGEEGAGTIAEVELYDPARRRWSSLPRLRTPRHGLGGVSRGRRVYAIEGGPTPGFDFSDAIEALDVPPRR
jgi:N-acetylneuraminic acid mutarotase